MRAHKGHGTPVKARIRVDARVCAFTANVCTPAVRARSRGSRRTEQSLADGRNMAGETALKRIPRHEGATPHRGGPY